jgi:hypothetical protein
MNLNIAEVAETTATQNTVKRSTMSKFKKLYKAVGWDQTTQSYTGKRSQ